MVRSSLLQLLVLYSLLGNATPGSNVLVANLTCDYRHQPEGIDQARPLLSWQLLGAQKGKKQSAYQVLVASSLEKLSEQEADWWNSGKIISDQSVLARYQGKPLTSRALCYWKVRVWDEKGKPSVWSEPSYWTMGLLTREEWKASWISPRFAEVSTKRSPFSSTPTPFDGSDSSAIYMRKEITVTKNITRAMVTISGLGYYELFINGEKIGDHVLDPVFTDYQKTVNYLTYDVTKQIHSSTNAIGVVLGNGFYNLPTQDLFQMNRAHWKTPNKLLFNLFIEFSDGTNELVVSDGSWKWSTGAIVYNSIRGGETIDMNRHQEGWDRAGFEDNEWPPAVIVPDPIGKLIAQSMPPLRITREVRPLSITEPKTGVYLVDFGENLTGWVAIKLRGRQGQTVVLHFNEVLKSDGTLDTQHSAGHTWGRFQKGVCVLSGKSEDIYEPRFLYHGFRYVQVEGLDYKLTLQEIIAKSVHTDLKPAGTFRCSNQRLNQLQSAIQRTLLNSVHSMPGEEATREKMGWTLDAGMVTMETYLMNYHAITTYRKYLQDLIDAQESNGHIPPIVPTNGWGFLEKDTTIQYDDPWWGGTIVFVANKLFEFTGDTSVLELAYSPMKKYVDFVRSTAKDDLVYWSLGDWLDLKQWSKGWGPGLTPVVQTSTAALYIMSKQLAENAKWLGKKEDARFYQDYSTAIKEKFNATFLDYTTGWYSPGSQTAQLVPLFFDMVPLEMKEKVEEKLLTAITDNAEHTSVGFIGVNPLLKYLSENRRLPLVYRMVTKEKSPGWLHMVKDEKSTMGENLNADGYGTGHHPFATNVGFWLYYYLGGIQPQKKFPGIKTICLQPGFETELDWVESSYESLYGTIQSNWKRKNDTILYNIAIPGNTNAILKLPVGYIAKDLDKISNRSKHITKAPSGEYILVSGMYELAIGKSKSPSANLTK
jgi:alpha-L-rhamnosidase